MTSISKNVYIDKLNDIVNEYNNTYQKTIKMAPVEVKSDNYLEYNITSSDKNHVRISKYKNTFAKG